MRKWGSRRQHTTQQVFLSRHLPNYELVQGEAKRLSRKSLKSIAEVWQIHHAEETIIVQNLTQGMAQENTQNHRGAREN